MQYTVPKLCVTLVCASKLCDASVRVSANILGCMQ